MTKNFCSAGAGAPAEAKNVNSMRFDTYTGTKFKFWPYDSKFLKKMAEEEKKGDPLFESASFLLKNIEGE